MTDLIFSTGLEWGVPPGGDQGGQGGLSFYVVTKGGQWSYMSPLKFGNQIQHGDDSVADLEDALLSWTNIIFRGRFENYWQRC